MLACGLGAAGITPSGLSRHPLSLGPAKARTTWAVSLWVAGLSREAERAGGRRRAGNQAQGPFVFPDTWAFVSSFIRSFVRSFSKVVSQSLNKCSEARSSQPGIGPKDELGTEGGNPERAEISGCARASGAGGFLPGERRRNWEMFSKNKVVIFCELFSRAQEEHTRQSGKTGASGRGEGERRGRVPPLHLDGKPSGFLFAGLLFV